MNGDQIHMIQQNGKGCHIGLMKYDITCLPIDLLGQIGLTLLTWDETKS